MRGGDLRAPAPSRGRLALPVVFLAIPDDQAEHDDGTRRRTRRITARPGVRQGSRPRTGPILSQYSGGGATLDGAPRPGFPPSPAPRLRDGVKGNHDPATSHDRRMRCPRTQREMRDRVGNELGRPIERRLDLDSCHPVPFLARPTATSAFAVGRVSKSQVWPWSLAGGARAPRTCLALDRGNRPGPRVPPGDAAARVGPRTLGVLTLPHRFWGSALAGRRGSSRNSREPLKKAETSNRSPLRTGVATVNPWSTLNSCSQ